MSTYIAQIITYLRKVCQEKNELFAIFITNVPKILSDPRIIADDEEKENNDGYTIDGEKIDEREPEE